MIAPDLGRPWATFLRESGRFGASNISGSLVQEVSPNCRKTFLKTNVAIEMRGRKNQNKSLKFVFQQPFFRGGVLVLRNVYWLLFWFGVVKCYENSRLPWEGLNRCSLPRVGQQAFKKHTVKKSWISEVPGCIEIYTIQSGNQNGISQVIAIYPKFSHAICFCILRISWVSYSRHSESILHDDNVWNFPRPSPMPQKCRFPNARSVFLG